MLVLSEKYPEITLVLDDKSYQFKEGKCDLPEFLALRITQMNREYKLGPSSVEEAKKEDKYFKFNPATWTKDYKKLIWDGPISMANGYGSASARYVRGLAKLIDLYVINSRWIGSDMTNVPSDLLKILDRSTDKIDSYYIKFFPAFEFTRKPAERFIGYTMLEASRIPESWVNLCNRYCERIIVPCSHQKQAFIDSGVTRDIAVIPLGLITDEFPVVNPPQDDLYYFGTMGTLTYRKGTDVLVKAFISGMDKKNYPNARLYIKTQPVGGISSMWFMTKNEFTDDGRIEFNTDIYTPKELTDEFFAKINCFVFSTRGEGFGLPALEAMCSGLPLIGTNWSGLYDFMNEDVALPLDYTLVPVPNATPENPNAFGGYPKDLQAKDQMWASPSEDDLIDKMRFCYNNREKAKEIGKRAAVHVRNNYDISVCSKKLINYLSKKF